MDFEDDFNRLINLFLNHSWGLVCQSNLKTHLPSLFGSSHRLEGPKQTLLMSNMPSVTKHLNLALLSSWKCIWGWDVMCGEGGVSTAEKECSHPSPSTLVVPPNLSACSLISCPFVSTELLEQISHALSLFCSSLHSWNTQRKGATQV